MKFAKLLFLVIVTLPFLSCNDNCSDVDAPDSASLFITCIDEVSGENVFENETFTGDQIVITDEEDELVSFSFVETKNFIHISFPAGLVTDKIITVKLENTDTSDIREIEIHLNIISQEEECYTLYKVDNVLFPNNESELVDGIYEVKI